MGLIDREWVGFSLRAVSLPSLLALLYLVVFGSIVAVQLLLLPGGARAGAEGHHLRAGQSGDRAGARVPWCCTRKSRQRGPRCDVLVLLGVALVLFQGLAKTRPAPRARASEPSPELRLNRGYGYGCLAGAPGWYKARLSASCLRRAQTLRFFEE